MRCLAEGGGAGCGPVDRPRFDLGVTSSVDNGAADYDLWTWSNVPPDATYVVYENGDATRWQRPVNGVAMFPNVHGFESVATAYTADGAEVVRIDAKTQNLANAEESAAPAETRELAGLEQGQGEAIMGVMNDAMRSCLANAGAVFDGGEVGRLPAGGDAESAWSSCVFATETAVSD